MKYLVNVSYTNPAHEHVSLRRRVDTVNRVVEARNEEEALNRVANQQRALGFLVRDAKVIEEAVSFGRSGGVMHYDPKTEKSEKDGTANIYDPKKDEKKLSPKDKMKKEEVEQIDELKKSTLASYTNKASKDAMHAAYTAGNTEIPASKKDAFIRLGKRAMGIERATKKIAKEEVEQTDEALLPKQQAVADKLKASELAANKEKAGYKFGKSLRAAKVAAKMKVNEVVDEKEPTKGKKAASKMTQKAAELRKDKIKGSANKVNMKPEVDLTLKGM
jgi:hypothetical protein